MKKPFLLIVYGFTIVALSLATSQLFESRVSAEESATCCTYSDVCPGTTTCWYPREGQAGCCNPDSHDCNGLNYCGQSGPPGGN